MVGIEGLSAQRYHHDDQPLASRVSLHADRIGHVIRTADSLAETLAGFARSIRDAAQTKMAHESVKGTLKRLHKAFQAAVIHDLTEESFADTYAQTITYGLLTAAISRTDMSAGRHGTVITADTVAELVPVTNPFLKEMLETFLTAGGRKGGIDFDELGIQDVVELLRGDETDLPEILRDFGNRTGGRKRSCNRTVSVTGLITAAGGAWNATTVSAFVQVKNQTFVAFGLGSTISQATASGNFHLLCAAVVTMAVFVVMINRFFWKRLYRLAEDRHSMYA